MYIHACEKRTLNLPTMHYSQYSGMYIITVHCHCFFCMTNIHVHASWKGYSLLSTYSLQIKVQGPFLKCSHIYMYK